MCSLSTLLFLCCFFVYSCISKDIGQEINECLNNASNPCIIQLDATTAHNISEDVNDAFTNNITPNITIKSADTEKARIIVNTALILTNYAATITFDNVIIDGSLGDSESFNFLEINTNKAAQIDILNSEIINFNTTTGVIKIVENIKSFVVHIENTSNPKVQDIMVDVENIDESNSFVTVNFETSKFVNNTNRETNGGVLSLFGHEFQVNINQCQFINNRATGWRKNGGCISWDRSSIPDILDSAVSDAQTDIVDDQKQANGPFYDYNFTNNSDETWMIRSHINILNSYFSDNHGEDAGGVAYIIQTKQYDEQIFELTKTVNITNSTNSTEIRGRISIIRDFELNSESNTFINNVAKQYGGVYRHIGYKEDKNSLGNIVLKCQDTYYRITIMDDIYINNSIPNIEGITQSFAFGAALSSACGQISVYDSNFTNNNAKYGSSLSIYASSAVTIDGCRFEGNEGYFGTVYMNGLLNATTGYYANITYSQFINNKAENDGAGISAVILDKLIVDNCYFQGNENRHYGTVSVQYFQHYNPMYAQITNSIFVDNSVESDDIIAGGAITAQRYDYEQPVYPLNCYNDDSSRFDDDIQGLTLFIDSCKFDNNNKSAVGLRVVSAYISNCMFSNNINDQSHGGAIQSIYSWFKVIDSTFISNQAMQTGGAISTGVLKYKDVYPNWILPNNDLDGLCRIQVENCTFQQNKAELGGSIFIGTSTTIIDNTFENNDADYGGVIAVSALSMTVQNNRFINNYAQVHGGCLFQTQYTNDKEMSDITSTSQQDVQMVIRQNTFQRCDSYIGGAVFLRTVLNQKIQVTDNNFSNCTAEDVGGGLVIGQLLPISEESIDSLIKINVENRFFNNNGQRAFNDYVSYPKQMYIKSENDSKGYSVSPGISTSAALGGYDVFGQDFESFMVTDWNTREENFEFYLNWNASQTAFRLLTVNSGSLSAGKANISFEVERGSEGEYAITRLGSNSNNLVKSINVSWELAECPPGYGYNENVETCELCERDTFKVEDGWDQCRECLDGLSCRGGEHVQILYKNWWDPQFSSDVDETFFCRLGDCCTKQDGCSPESEERCPTDRDPESVGCGDCKNGLSAMHGSHKCAECGHLSKSEIFFGAIIAFVIWPLILIFLFGLAKYDGSSECQKFYSISIIEITIILLMDYYQSLPAILTFTPDAGTYFLINLFFARIPITQRGLCLFDGMDILQKTYWDLLIPSIILTLSFIIFAVSLSFNRGRERTTDYSPTNIFYFGKTGWVYDPLRCVMFSLFFCIIPMLWSCSHLFSCIEYGKETVFWNAPGQRCEPYIVAIMAVLFVALALIYVIANIYYSHSRLIRHDDIVKNKKLIPLYLQRLQPFYFMVYPFDDDNSRRHSMRSMKLTWHNITFRGKRDFAFLYVGWISPFLRKVTCLLTYATIIGPKGQSDQTFIVTNLTLATLVLYQLFSQDYTSADNYTLHLYCLYLLYWLVLLIVSGSTKIISENEHSMPTLKDTVNAIMWIPAVSAVIAICFAFLLLKYPKLLIRDKQSRSNEKQRQWEKKKTMNAAFHSKSVLPGMDDNDDISKSDNVSKSDNAADPGNDQKNGAKLNDHDDNDNDKL